MQTRLSFNSGEVDEGVALRQDLEACQRSCWVVENWHVTESGALERRKGMRKIGETVKDARLFAYVYTHAAVEGMRYLVEVQAARIKVRKLTGEVVKEWDTVATLGYEADPLGLSAVQIYALLLFTSLQHAPFVVKWDGRDKWELEKYNLVVPPWRYNEEREGEVKLETDKNGKVTVSFDAAASEEEKRAEVGDTLRLSWWTEQQETVTTTKEILNGVAALEAMPSFAVKGMLLAMHEEDYVQYWICKETWNRETLYTEGLDDPANYKNNFEQAENTAGYDGVKVVTSVLDVNGGKDIEKNTKFGMRIGYWKYFTCIKDVDITFPGGAKMEDYPEYFQPGLPVGKALVCRGAWSFYCAGLWYGSYEVRRNYETDDLTSSAWEALGSSFSRVGNNKNTEISGDESEEECYLRLYITSSRYINNDPKAGFPPEGNGNKLIVEGYRHDEMLEYTKSGWVRKNKVKLELPARRRVSNWSWAAFSRRYGYPMHACTFNKRLVFASTSRQPQTMFLSAVDDLTNFFVSNLDAGAFTVSLTTGSLNPICWLAEKRGSLVLGTSEGEWEFGPATAQSGLSAANNAATTHSFNGSANYIASIGTKNKIVYVQRGARAVQDFGYDIEADGYRSREISILCQHIMAEHGGILRGAMANVPRCELYFVLGDGQLAVCNYNEDQAVKAWGRWVTRGAVRDVCTVTNGNEDDLIYLIVEREGEVNIEVIHPENDYEDAGGDYESVMVTTPLNNLIEQQLQMQESIPFELRLGGDFENEPGAMQVSRDGKTWVNIDRRAPVLERGWHKLVALQKWSKEPVIGVKVTGNRGCKLIALQG